MFANMGLSGFSFIGADIGGFAEVPSAELFTRWLQTGVFYPFMRAHTTFGTPDQEPWSYRAAFEEINRRAIEMRYQLLPQIYTVMEEASRTGLPALRPLVLEYPDDPATYQRQDEFLFGRDLLVAPVLREGATEREVYLPRAPGTNTRERGATKAAARSGVRHHGRHPRVRARRRHRVPAARRPAHGEMAGQTLRLLVSAADAAEGTQYEDDGHSLAHQRGSSLAGGSPRGPKADGGPCRRRRRKAPYRPAARDLEVEVRGLVEPQVGDGGHGSAGPRRRGGLGHRARGLAAHRRRSAARAHARPLRAVYHHRVPLTGREVYSIQEDDFNGRRTS
jgi:alpha-glucosidase